MNVSVSLVQTNSTFFKDFTLDIESTFRRDVTLSIRPFIDGLQAVHPVTGKDGRRCVLGFPVANVGYRQFVFTDITLTGERAPLPSDRGDKPFLFR